MRNPWNLKYTVFGKNATPEQTLKEWYAGCLKLEKLGKTLYRSKKDLLEWIILYNKLWELQTRLNVFFNEKLKTCSKKSKWAVLSSKFEKQKKLTNKIDEVNNGIIYNHEKKIKLLLNSKELKEYRRFFETTFFYDKHHQASRVGQIKRSAIQANDIVESIFKDLNKDKDSYWCLDENNEYISSNNWSEIMTNPSKHIRYHVWCNWYGQYRERCHLYCRLFYILHFRLGQDSTYDGYGTYIEKDLMSNYELSLKNYRKILLYSQTFTRLNIRFKDHLAGIISRENLISNYEPWDYQFGAKISCYKFTDSKEEAERIILESYKCLGKEFCDAAKWVFDHKLINWSRRRNNNTVGSTLTAMGMLNTETINFEFEGTISDISTLSHEIGHAVSYYFSKKHQKTYKSHNTLNTEIPSMVCQYITMLWCIKNLPHRMPKLCAMIEILASFEWLVSKYSANALFKLKLDQVYAQEGYQSPKTIIEANYLYRKWFEGLTKYEKHWNKDEKYNLTRFQFFESYYDEFVNNEGIMYYIGAIVGLAYAQSIMIGCKPELRDFIKFLKAGSSKKPLSSLMTLKVNLLKPNVYSYSKEVLKSILVQFEKEPTLNKRGSLQYGKENQEFNDKYEKIK